MNRKVTWHEEEESDYEDTITSEDEESDNEEPRFKGVLEGLSQLVSRQKVSDLLHSMAASKDILFWTPRGQSLLNQRIIPLNNISELVEYVLLPHNDDVVEPRALKTFIDGNLKEMQTFHILKKPQVQRFCLKEKVLTAIATEGMFTKEQ